MHNPLIPNSPFLSSESISLETDANSVLVSELLLIQQQTDLITEISKNYQNSKKFNTFSTQDQDISFDLCDNSHQLNVSLSGIGFRNDNSKFLEEESFEQALKEIRKSCSRKTYNFIRDKFRYTEDNRKSNKLEKQIRHNQELTRRCLNLTQEIKILKEKVENLQKNKESLMKKNPSLKVIDKEGIYLKLEKSLVYKQKAHAQSKKNIDKQYQLLQEEKKQNEQIKQQIHQILQKIEESKVIDQDLKQIIKIVKENLDLQTQIAKSSKQEHKKFHLQIDRIISSLKNELK